MGNVKRKYGPRVLVLGLAGIALTGCMTTSNEGNNPADIAEYRQARFQEMTGLQNYQDCRKEVLQLSDQARVQKSPGGYLTSAQVAEKCLSGVAAHKHVVPVGERMRLHSVAVLNYLRAGDIASANSAFASFKRAYPEKDLYFTDGTSFIKTMEAFLARTDKQSFGEFAALNVNRGVKREMRRINHWKTN